MSANFILRDEAIRHALHSEKYSKGLATKIVRLLNSADADLVETIAKRMALIDERGFDLGPATTKRLNGLLTEIRSVNDAVYSKVAKGLKADLADYAEHEAEWAATGLKSATGISDLNLPTAQYLRQLVERSPVDGHLLDSWTSTMSANRQGRVEQAIRLGLVQGQTTDQIVARIRGTRAAQYTDGVLQISRNSAQTMVLTASSTVASNARGEVYKANSHIIKQVQWLSTLDSRTSPVCQSRDGQTWSVDSDHPKTPAHPRCRSVLIPVTKSFREMGIDKDEVTAEKRASMDGQVAGKSNFEDWIGRQSVVRQDEVFGPQRAQLYRDGQVTFRDLFRANGEYKSLDELRRVERSADVPSTPSPEPVAPRTFSPIDPTVNADTIAVRPRLAIQKEMTSALTSVARDPRFMATPEFKGVTVAQFGKASFPTAFTDQSVSMIAAIWPEIDALTDAFGVPRLRGVRQITSAIGNMGDNVLGLNPAHFNGFASKVGAPEGGLVGDLEKKRDALYAQMATLKKQLEKVRADRQAMKVRDEAFFALMTEEADLIKSYNALVKPINKVTKELSSARKASVESVSQWKRGDDPKGRPHGSPDYFTGIDKARAVMFHETAHAVHQMHGKTVPRHQAKPPLEIELERIFLRKYYGVTPEHRAAVALRPTEYSGANSKEWFAENFALYMMGRLDLVDEEVKDIIERLLNERG